MIGKKDKVERTDIKSILSEGLKIEGNISFQGKIRIDGEVKGDIEGDYIILGKSAKVTGNLKTKTVIVQGNVKGNISSDRVEIKSGAEVVGDINTNSLSIDSGANIQGMVNSGKFTKKPQKESISIREAKV